MHVLRRTKPSSALEANLEITKAGLLKASGFAGKDDPDNILGIGIPDVVNALPQNLALDTDPIGRGFTNVSLGQLWQTNTAYTKFFTEALIKPTFGAAGSILSAGNGGNHLQLLQVTGDQATGFALSGNIFDSDSSTATTLNSVDRIRYNEWAHVALAYDSARLTWLVNGVPSASVACTQQRKVTAAFEAMAWLLGSDHNMFGGRFACIRGFENAVPYDNPHQFVVRPAIAEMARSFVFNGATQVVATFLIDPRNGNLLDSGQGQNGRRANGFLSNSQNGVANNTYSLATALPSPLPLAKWVQDQFAYSQTHPAPKNPPVGAVFYDSFGRKDVHFGNSNPPLGLGRTELGNAAWVGDYYGILNGRTFGTELAINTVANFNTGLVGDRDVRWTRPVGMSIPAGIGAAMHFFPFYLDDNNWIRLIKDEFGAMGVGQMIAGVFTDFGGFAFNTGWAEVRAHLVGGNLNVYADGALQGTQAVTPMPTATKVGFRCSTPLLGISEIAVLPS